MDSEAASNLLSDLVVSCQAFDPATIDQRNRLWLTSLLWELSRQTASQLSDEIVAASDVPGYLRISTPVGEVLTPFHLAQFVHMIDFPVLKKLADEVRISPDTSICLSGSTTFNVPFIGDIDFCEYTSLSGNRVPQTFHYHRSDDDKRFLVGIEHDGRNALDPKDVYSSKLCPTDDGSLDSKCVCNIKTWYITFVKRPKRGTYLPVSNMVVPDGEDAREYSWAYQEAMFPSPLARPRNLALPSEFANYVAWLLNQMSKNLKEKKYAKALKRALSLCTLMNYEKPREKLYEFLEDSELGSITIRESINELEQTVKFLDDSLRRNVRRFILRQRASLPDGEAITETTQTQVSTLCEEVFNVHFEKESEARTRIPI